MTGVGLGARNRTVKRFYRDCGVAPGERGVLVTLDGRAMTTPKRAALDLPTRALARAIAAEWAAQGEEVDPASMPLTRLAATAIDRVAAERPAGVADLAAYGGSDLVCYRAEAPRALVERQHEVWQPLVRWFATRHGAMLAVTRGIVPIGQPEPAVAALRRVLDAMDDFETAAVFAVAVSTGSLIVALALLDGRLTGREAFEAGCLDDLYALETWGEDREARDRLDRLRDDILAVERFLGLLRAEA